MALVTECVMSSISPSTQMQKLTMSAFAQPISLWLTYYNNDAIIKIFMIRIIITNTIWQYLISHNAVLTFNHIYQQIHIIGFKNCTKFQKLLHVLASRRHPQGVSNAKEQKHQCLNLEIQSQILYYSYRALSSIKHKHSTNKCTIIIIIIIIILDIYYNSCKPVQHVSIPSWDHHLGHLWEYKLHKLKPTI
jgi:hypothetical protein